MKHIGKYLSVEILFYFILVIEYDRDLLTKKRVLNIHVLFSWLLNTTHELRNFTFPEAPSPMMMILSCLSGASSSESDIFSLYLSHATKST